MAFEFKLSNDEIRNKMFDFIKPVYKNTWDFDVSYINWIYGIYDSKTRFFITYVKSKSGDAQYVLINGNGDLFYVVTNSYNHKIIEIPDELMQHSDIIQDGIKLYNNEKVKKSFKDSFSSEQEKYLNDITENMKDKCKLNFVINSFEDAEKLFELEKYSYYQISHMYNKNTVANFDKYMPDSKMRAIIGEKYKAIISKISAYSDVLSKEDYNHISKDFHEAGNLILHGIDDIYANITFEVIKKAYFCGVVSVGYVDFIINHVRICIQSFSDRIKELCPLLDFINENMRSENFKSLELYRKELEKLIYQKTEGFQFVCTTDELREKMFDYLKPEYKSKYDLDVTGINWTTGVYDKESGIFLTLIYSVSDGIARCGVNYHSYIVITGNGNIFQAANNDEYEKRRYDFRIPEQYKELTDMVKKGIDYYENAYEYRKLLSEDTRKKLKAIDDIMDDRCHRNFPINCEKDAYKLFKLVNFNICGIHDTYNKRTINDFNEFASKDKIIHWRGHGYLKLLGKVKNPIIENPERCRIFNHACYLFGLGVDDTYDKQFLKAVKYMYKLKLMDFHEENILKEYIGKYVETYPDRLKNIMPLIKFVKIHAENKYLKDSAKNVRISFGKN